MKKLIINNQRLLLAFLAATLLVTGCRETIPRIIESLWGEAASIDVNDPSPPKVRMIFHRKGVTQTLTPESDGFTINLDSPSESFYLILQGEDEQGVKEIRFWSNSGAECILEGEIGEAVPPSLGMTEKVVQSGPRATTKLSKFQNVFLNKPCKDANNLKGYTSFNEYNLIAENFSGQSSDLLTLRFEFSSP